MDGWVDSMQLEIEGRHKNLLLHREEINFEILNVNKTPSRKEVRTKVAAALGVNEELIMVDEIDHEFGSTRIVGFAKKYDSVEDLKRVEPSHMRQRHGEKIEVKNTKPAEGKGA